MSSYPGGPQGAYISDRGDERDRKIYEGASAADRLAILGLSEAGNERDELKEQMTLAGKLRMAANKYESKAPSHPIGGAAFAIGQGLEGYMAGKEAKENKEALKALREQNIQARNTYNDLLFKKEEPSPFKTLSPNEWAAEGVEERRRQEEEERRRQEELQQQAPEFDASVFAGPEGE